MLKLDQHVSNNDTLHEDLYRDMYNYKMAIFSTVSVFNLKTRIKH